MHKGQAKHVYKHTLSACSGEGLNLRQTMILPVQFQHFILICIIFMAIFVFEKLLMTTVFEGGWGLKMWIFCRPMKMLTNVQGLCLSLNVYLCPSPTVPNLFPNVDECQMFEIRANSCWGE